MKKIFRLANAEFNKIFYRPSIFILTALLIIALIGCNFIFKPTSNTTKLQYASNNVEGIYTTFIGTSKNETTKKSIDADFEDTYNTIVEQYNSIVNEDKLKLLNSKITLLNNDITLNLKEEITRISPFSETEFKAQKNITVQVFNSVKQKASDLINYMSTTIKNEVLNFYLKNSDYETIYNQLMHIFNIFPNDYSEYTKNNFIVFGNSIIENVSLKNIETIIANLEKVTIDSDAYDNLIQKYYLTANVNLQTKYFTEIDNFYKQHFNSNSDDDIASINTLISNYYSYAYMNKTVLKNSFELLRINNVSDTQLKDFIGYGEISKYQLNEQISINTYLIENNQFDYNFLTSFNFNKASGATTNAFDYTIFSMQILTILIIVFTIFYACSTIAGDQTSGTMKMIAIRPYTRNKLFAGKYLSCVMFGVMLMLISLFASFIVGAILYGVPTLNCLVVFNSSTAFVINPFILLFIYFISLIINLLFYISLAMFICLIFKSNTLSVFIASILYFIQIIFNGLISSVWLKYTPFGHFDLFKYFGNSELGFLKFNILPDANFFISALIIGLMIVVFNVISHMIFKSRDIA